MRGGVTLPGILFGSIGLLAIGVVAVLELDRKLRDWRRNTNRKAT